MSKKLNKDFFEGKTLRNLLNELMTPSRPIDQKWQIILHIEENYINLNPKAMLAESKRKLEGQNLPDSVIKNILSAQKTAVDISMSLLNLDQINGMADIDKVFGQMKEVHGEEAYLEEGKI